MPPSVGRAYLGSTRLLPNRLPQSSLGENDYCEASFGHLQNEPFFSTLVHMRISLIKSCLSVDCYTYPSTFWLVSQDIGSTCAGVTCKTQGRTNENPNFVIHTSCHLFFITFLFPAVLITQFIHFRVKKCFTSIIFDRTAPMTQFPPMEKVGISNQESTYTWCGKFLLTSRMKKTSLLVVCLGLP